MTSGRSKRGGTTVDKCPGLGDMLSAYLDGELDRVASQVVADHLVDCPRCHAEFEGLRQVKRFLAPGSPLAPPLPRELVGRVRASLYPPSPAAGQVRRPAFWRWPRAWLAAPILATGLLIAALLAGMLGDDVFTPSPAAAAATASLTDHINCARLGRVVESLPGDAAQVSEVLAGALGMRIALPRELPAGYHFLGGRTIRIGDSTAAHLAWSEGTTMLSFYQAADPGGAPPSDWRTVRLTDHTFWFSPPNGEHAILWRGADTLYLLVGDLPEDTLLQAALTAPPP
jgi:anti-sigma factor RsiW